MLAEVFSRAGVRGETFAQACIVVDKLDKVGEDEVASQLRDMGIAAESVEAIFEALRVRRLDDLAALLGDDSDALADLTTLFAIAESYGVGDWLSLDVSVVRGLAYYTGIVFEGFDRAGKFRAIFGGGRYDRLLETMGGDAMPAAGFGFGDAVIVELLREKGLLPTSLGRGVEAVVFPLEESYRLAAVDAADALRERGVAVDLVLDSRKPKWAFKHADRLGARFLVLIGAEEVAEGAVSVKDLSESRQSKVSLDEACATILAGRNAGQASADHEGAGA